MGSIGFTVDMSAAEAALKRVFADLSATQIPQAIAASANRTVDTGRASIVRTLSQELMLKVASIREVVTGLKVSRSDAANGKTASIKLKDSARPLFDYPHSVGARGIRIRVRKERTEYHRMKFIAKMKSGHVGIFMRVKGRDKKGKLTTGATKGKGRKSWVKGAGFARRFPVAEQLGPGVTSTFENAGKIAEQEVAKLGDVMAKNLKSQIDRFKKPPKGQ